MKRLDQPCKSQVQGASSRISAQAAAVQPSGAQSSATSTAAVSGAVSAQVSGAPATGRKKLLTVVVPVAVVLVVLVVAAGLYFRSQSRNTLTQQDTIVLADFTNTTGDPVFDGTLKQALAVDLDQSPFLQVVPPARIQEETLTFMGRSPDERLTTDLARDLCLRVGQQRRCFPDRSPAWARSTCSP